MEQILYKKGYKYQLVKTYDSSINIKPEQPITTDYIELSEEGRLIIKKGYAWDGPSGPTVDTLNFMKGSLVHDALYQLMREKHLDKEEYRQSADRLLQKICEADGMSRLRAWWVYLGIRWAGDPAADSPYTKPVIKAPNPSR